MSHARERSLRLRRLCLEDTLSTFSVAKDFISGDDRFIERLMFSDIHEVASDGNRTATLTVDDFCSDLLSSVLSARKNADRSAHVWLRGKALTGKTWVALRVMNRFAQAALDQLRELEASNEDLSAAFLLPLPLFIPALKLARSRPSTVESYVRSSHGLDASDELVRFLLEELECKRVMLFVDGLDDITRHRPLVVKYIEHVLLPSNPCVFLTSRVESVHWLSATAFSSARSFATDAASFDSQLYPVFLEGMSSKQITAMRYLLSPRFNLPPHDLVTSHSPGHALIDCVGGLAIASSLVMRDSATQCSMSLVVQCCDAYLRELLFAADSRKFVLISSDVDAERGRDQRLLGSPACLALLESIASLAIQKAARAALRSDDVALSPVHFTDQDVSSVIEANPQYGGIWSCLFKSSPVINWGAVACTSETTYTFAHPFILHLIVARATAAKLHAGENISWLLTRRIAFSREHRGLLSMLAAMLRSESFVKLVTSLSNVIPSYRPGVFLLTLALTSHRPHLELQTTDTKALISTLKSNAFSITAMSSLILHSSSPCLRSFAIDIVRASDASAMSSLLVDSLALLQAVSTHAFPNSGDTALRALACVHFLLKFADEMKFISMDAMLDHCRSIIDVLCVVVSDSEQLECVRLQGIECMFTHLTAVMRSVPSFNGENECDDRLVFCISASLGVVDSCEDSVRQFLYCHIKRVPFLQQLVADHRLHQQACFLIRSGSDDVRLFPSVAIEFACPQHERRTSAVLAAACLFTRDDMRALIIAHLRDSSRHVRVAVAAALKEFHHGSLSVFEAHNIAHCLCVALLLESVPEVVVALMSTLAVFFPPLVLVPSAAADAMQQHPAVFDLISHWICQKQNASCDETVVATESILAASNAQGSEFWTLDQLLRELLNLKSRIPSPPPSVSCKLILILAFISKSKRVSADVASRTATLDHAHISQFLVTAAASVSCRPAAAATAPHSCVCAFIRMCGSRDFIPLFLRVDVPRLLSLAGVHAEFCSRSSSNVPTRDAADFKLQNVSFSAQTYFWNAKTQDVVLEVDFEGVQSAFTQIDVYGVPPSPSTLSNEFEGPNEVLRSQLANEFVLEVISAVQSCIQAMSKDDPRSVSSACQGACAFAFSIISNDSTFEISHDLLCATLSLITTAGVLSIHLATEMLNFSVSFQGIIAAVVKLTSHSSWRVRVAALQALSSEFTFFIQNRVAQHSLVTEFPLVFANLSGTLASIRRVLTDALRDDTDTVVSSALTSLASVVSVDEETSVSLFDSVAASLKETLTLCLSKAEGRSKGTAKVQVLLEYTIAALFSDSPPALDRIERSCTEIRRICKWFPSSHKPPPCAQPLRLQAIKATSRLLSCKRLVSQGKIRALCIDAVEGCAAAQSDSVSLAAVEIAVRHRLLEGQLFQPILAILQSFDSEDSALIKPQAAPSPLLQQCLTTCSMFDNLPSSIVALLLSLSVKFPYVASSVQIIGDGFAVESSDETICQWLRLLFNDKISAPAFEWIVRWCKRAALQPQWLLPNRVQLLLEEFGSSSTSINVETQLFVCFAISQGWLCDVHVHAASVASSKWWNKWLWA